MLHPDLRPLSIGEILDRAVTLFVKRFAVLILILALVAIPIAIIQYASQPDTLGLFGDIQRIIAVPPGHPEEQRAILREITAKSKLTSLVAVLLVANALLGVLATTACMIAVAQAYAGRLPSVREVYREALRRWPAQLAAGLIFSGAAFVLFIVFFLVTFLAVLAVSATGALAHAAPAVIAIPLIVIALVVGLMLGIMFFFVVQMTLVAIALEEPNPIRGIAHGLRRTLSRAMFWRTAVVATVVFIVSLVGALLLTSIAAAVSALTHVSALYPVVAVTGGVALNALITCFIVLYAIDVRVRREGYDLVLAARESAA